MGIANQITLFRIILVPLFIVCLTYYTEGGEFYRWLAFFLFGVAALTDALDGAIARKRREITSLGAMLDPLADKMLILSGFICLATVKSLPLSMRVPAWLSITVVSRDTMILLGSVLIFVMTGKLEVKPSRLGKVTTTFQMITILFLLSGWMHPLSEVLIVITGGLTLLSGLGYLRIGMGVLSRAAGEI